MHSPPLQDNCGSQDQIGPPERGYAVMRDALNATGRSIFFAACEWVRHTTDCEALDWLATHSLASLAMHPHNLFAAGCRLPKHLDGIGCQHLAYDIRHPERA